MSDKHIIQELKGIRIDCMYGKKKHYNARDRYSKYHTRLGIAIIVITSFMGTSVFFSLSENALLHVRIITGLLIVLDAVLAGLQTFFNFEKRALEHKLTADKYLALMKKSQRFISYYKYGNTSMNEIKGEIERLSQEIQDIQKNEPEVSPRDYQKAKEGIKDGEEIYIDEEKKI